MDEPRTRTITMTCPTRGCDASRLVVVQIAQPLSELGEQTCPRGHRFVFSPNGQAVAVDEPRTP